MNKIAKLLCYIASPLTFLITLPICYPIWETYKKAGYKMPCYLQFFWDRNIKLRMKSYKKK